MQAIFQHGRQNVLSLPHHRRFSAYVLSEQVQLPLPKEAGGGDIVGFVPTWVSARRVLHMLLSAQWHPGLPFTFLITLKFSHMVPLPSWTSVLWQLVLETNCALRALKFHSHSREGSGLDSLVCLSMYAGC